MSAEFKSQVRDLVWQLIQQHYNVDRKQPYLLTSKSIVTTNPINEIADSLSIFIEQMLMEVARQKDQSFQEEEDTFSSNKQQSPELESPPMEYDEGDEFYLGSMPSWDE